MIRPLLARLRSLLLPATGRQDQFFTLSTDLFCRVSLEGRFLQVNPAFQHQLGYDEDELLHQPYTRLVDQQDHARIAEAIERLASGGAVRGLEARVHDHEGRVHWVESMPPSVRSE